MIGVTAGGTIGQTVGVQTGRSSIVLVQRAWTAPLTHRQAQTASALCGAVRDMKSATAAEKR
jgi:hypothetical protein